MLEEPLWDVEDPGSPAPLVNTRYRLAGGMDTPGVAAQRMEESEGEYFDVGYRRQLSGVEGRGTCGKGLLERDGNERTRAQRSYPQDSPGWGRPILQVVGGVVGKVWEFCKMGAFRGFHAGGGEGYDLNSGHEGVAITEDEKSFWEDEKRNGEFGIVSNQGTPLPGRFPEEDYIPNYMDFASPNSNTTPPRPAKRRQVRSIRDDITKNWVVVPPQSTSTFTPTRQQASLTPTRYSLSTTTSSTRRPTLSFASPRPASRAHPTRRPILPLRSSYTNSPSLRPVQSASYASPRSPGGSRIPIKSTSPTRGGGPSTPSSAAGAAAGSSLQDSPAAREAQKWAAVKKREEREADESIRRLDRQLKNMIREGKEALGTRVEVHFGEEVDGGVGVQQSLRSRSKSPGKRASVRKWAV